MRDCNSCSVLLQIGHTGINLSLYLTWPVLKRENKFLEVVASSSPTHCLILKCSSNYETSLFCSYFSRFPYLCHILVPAKQTINNITQRLFHCLLQCWAYRVVKLLFYDFPNDCKPMAIRSFLTLYSHGLCECLREHVSNTPSWGIIL